MVHRRPVYSEAADALVREIAFAEPGDERARTKLAHLLLQQYNEFDRPNVARLERVLRALRDQLRAEGKARGWRCPIERSAPVTPQAPAGIGRIQESG